MRKLTAALLAGCILSAPAYAAEPAFDVLIENGRIVDGSGNPWYLADIGIKGDRIAAIGKLHGAKAGKVIDAGGHVVSPGFIDMLDQSGLSLVIDSRSQSKLSQGITTLTGGEATTVSPQTPKTIAAMKPFLDQLHFTIDWTTLDGYFKRLERQGTPVNYGTYVGATQIREAVIGADARAPTTAELDQMKALTAQAMKDGALGLSSALIYPPAAYAKTDELIAMAKVVGQYGGIYATHMRSEGTTETEALDEAIRIGREGGVPVEIFHLKVVGKPRWGTMSQIIDKIQAARKEGLDIRADAYPYIAGGTSLAAAVPPWVADGGGKKLLERLQDPQIRARIKSELAVDHKDWENLFRGCDGGKGILIAGIGSPELKKFEGKTIAEIAAMEGKDEIDAMMDLIVADKGQTGAIYFMMSEDDLRYALRQPFVSIGMDADEKSLDGPLASPNDHPRAWGTFPRFLGRYVRDEGVTTLEDAVRRITSMPAQREHLTGRGLIETGFFADITIFDPATIADRATFKEPTQLSQGIDVVLVNGQVAFDHGKLTGTKSGRVLRGPGYHQ